MYDITALGFVPATFDALVSGVLLVGGVFLFLLCLGGLLLLPGCSCCSVLLVRLPAALRRQRNGPGRV